jgi:hypothetical protein
MGTHGFILSFVCVQLIFRQFGDLIRPVGNGVSVKGWIGVISVVVVNGLVILQAHVKKVPSCWLGNGLV